MELDAQMVRGIHFGLCAPAAGIANNHMRQVQRLQAVNLFIHAKGRCAVEKCNIGRQWAAVFLNLTNEKVNIRAREAGLRILISRRNKDPRAWV